MRKAGKTIRWFEEVAKEDVPLAGGKGANLGEMVRSHIPVPPGFIVTSSSYVSFLQSFGLQAEIDSILEPLDPEDSRQLQQASARIKEAILSRKMSLEMVRAVKAAYRKLGGGPVAVRSSATAEDLPEASFAGLQRTFLNVEGEDQVVAAIREGWASLYEPRAIYYRHRQGFPHSQVSIAVVVQKMVQSEVSGVMFTVEPVTSDRSKILIEAILGLGEAIVSGEVTPDLYLVDKESLDILERRPGRQTWQLVCRPQASAFPEEAHMKVELSPEQRARLKLTDQEVKALARLGREVELHYGYPQDLEWARENGWLYILQTRPVTTLKAPEREQVQIQGTLLLSGSPASPGVAAGPVIVIRDALEIGQVKPGDILVAEMTTPDFVPAMKRAAAIVTDRGGRTCHAAIVSRELGVPCVVGTERATQALRPCQVVTVDGDRGRVYEGDLTAGLAPHQEALRQDIKTVTRVYVNLAEPELAGRVACRNVDGVGLLRAEFIIAGIGEHPNYMLSQGRGQEFIDKLAEGLASFASAFYPRPVVYRTTDFKTNEYRNLKGGQGYEPVEENPMLGYRGCSRYVAELEAFKLETEAIKKVRQEYKNLWVMIPFVRTVSEMAQVKDILEAEGLRRSPDFKLWMMVEVPSNIFLLDKFLDLGIDGISIGTNDLTQLILGIDRDSPKLADKFDERNEAVLIALEQAIKTCARRGVTSSVCGQAPSVYPELTAKLVEWGITSVSVSPDMIDKTRSIIAEVEARLGRRG